jgi:hypothetical protein
MLSWVERMLNSIHTWDSFYESPIGTCEYLDRTLTEKEYYWREFNDVQNRID